MVHAVGRLVGLLQFMLLQPFRILAQGTDEVESKVVPVAMSMAEMRTEEVRTCVSS